MDEGPKRACPACGAMLPLEATRCGPCRLDLDPNSASYKRRMAVIARMVRHQEEFATPRPFLGLMLDMVWRPWTVFDRMVYQATEPTVIAGTAVLFLIGCAVPVWTDLLYQGRPDWLEALQVLGGMTLFIAMGLALFACGVRWLANLFDAGADFLPLYMSLLMVAGVVGSLTALRVPLESLGEVWLSPLYLLLAFWTLVLIVAVVSRTCDVHSGLAVVIIVVISIVLCGTSGAVVALVDRLRP